MPTSSQALIILATDGRLPKNVPRRTFPVSHVPYPTRNLDVSRLCMECNDNDEYTPENVYEAMRKRSVRLSSLSESLPDILKISRYRGTLTYDIESRLLHWQVNTESVPRKTDDNYVLGLHGNKWQSETQEHVRFPDIYHNNRNDYGHSLTDRGIYQNLQNNVGNREIDSEKYYLGGEDVVLEENKTVQSNRAPSLPMLFKARIDDETYRRLCGLNFRQKKTTDGGSPDKGNNSTKTFQNVAFGGWNSVEREDNDVIQNNPETQVPYEKIKDKDFRIEDLNLNTHTMSSETTMSYRHGNNENLQQYLTERNAFFAKYGNAGNIGTSDERRATGPEENYFGQKLKARKLLQEKIVLPNMTGIASYRQRLEEQDMFDESEDIASKPQEKMSLLDEVKEKSNYNKWKKKRLTSVRLRKQAPSPNPLWVCFSLKDNARNHSEIKCLVEDQIGTPVEGIQFDPVSVHAIDSDARSRWIVKMCDISSRDLLLDIGLIVDDDRVEVKLLDDAIKEEVEAYKLYSLVQKGQLRMPGESDLARVKRRKSRAQVVAPSQISTVRAAV